MIQKNSDSFFQRVYEVVLRIPKGKVITYGQIAAFLGNPRSARMVGWAMHVCPNGLPWYRVVMKSGKLPFDAILNNSPSQRMLLENEGISFLEDGKVNVEKHLWQIDLPL